LSCVLQGFRLVIDGHRIGSLLNGQHIDTDVPAGRHVAQLTVRAFTVQLDADVGEGETVTLWCRAGSLRSMWQEGQAGLIIMWQ
jgi:hypothetical protein